jgi:hypothetical protein
MPRSSTVVKRLTLTYQDGEMSTVSSPTLSVRELYRRADGELRLIAQGVAYTEAASIAAVANVWMQLSANNVHRIFLTKRYHL